MRAVGPSKSIGDVIWQRRYYCPRDECVGGPAAGRPATDRRQSVGGVLCVCVSGQGQKHVPIWCPGPAAVSKSQTLYSDAYRTTHSTPTPIMLCSAIGVHDATLSNATHSPTMRACVCPCECARVWSVGERNPAVTRVKLRSLVRVSAAAAAAATAESQDCKSQHKLLWRERQIGEDHRA